MVIYLYPYQYEKILKSDIGPQQQPGCRHYPEMNLIQYPFSISKYNLGLYKNDQSRFELKVLTQLQVRQNTVSSF